MDCHSQEMDLCRKIYQFLFLHNHIRERIALNFEFSWNYQLRDLLNQKT